MGQASLAALPERPRRRTTVRLERVRVAADSWSGDLWYVLIRRVSRSAYRVLPISWTNCFYRCAAWARAALCCLLHCIGYMDFMAFTERLLPCACVVGWGLLDPGGCRVAREQHTPRPPGKIGVRASRLAPLCWCVLWGRVLGLALGPFGSSGLANK
jgi:hypothetical protein